MTQEEKVHLKSVLLEKRESLAELIADLKEATKPQGLDNAIGRVSRMDYINNKSVGEASLRKSESDLEAIDRCLSLYETKKFGCCSRCGNEINMNRLLLMPQSTQCIHCAGRR